MKSTILKFLLLAAVSVGAGSPAWASPYIVGFTFYGFADRSPVKAVSGSITYEAGSRYGPVDSIVAVDLTINGHTYTVQELAFRNDRAPSWNTSTIGGLINGAGGISDRTTDFEIRWHTQTHKWEDFLYASDDVEGIWGVAYWNAAAGSRFTITAAPVPEPTAWATLLAGLLLLGGVIQRRKARNSRSGYFS